MSDKDTSKAAPAAPAKDIKNGVTRPSTGTKTGRVWAIADAQSAKLGSPALRKDVLAETAGEGINPSTAATQYGRWRKYHGLEGKGTEAAAPVAETEDHGVEEAPAEAPVEAPTAEGGEEVAE